MLFTLINSYSITEEVKKSRFIANATSINSREEVNRFIAQVSDPNATHNCWAWKLGKDYRFNDDGEPTSTAGRPIFAAIEGQHCDQVVIVVTRYFGGIKLGTGGLIRAYGGCASHCLQQAALKPIILRITCNIFCLYNEWPIVENRLKEMNAIIEKQTFNESGTYLQIAITEDQFQLLDEFIRNLTRGRERLQLTG